MTKEFIEFKKERDLGSIITDAFKFIRLEGKPFFTTIFKTSALPILIAVAAMMYYMYSFSKFGSQDMAAVGSMVVSMLVAFIAFMTAMVFMNLSGMFYIKSYIENNGKVDEQEIIANSKERFWSFFGFIFLSGIIAVAAMMLCFFPFFYVWPALSLGASILVFQNESATSAIGKCFEFIKGHFWETLGVVLVVSILISILGYVFQIPAFIYQMVKMMSGMQNEDPTAVLGIFSDPIYLGLYAISIFGQLLFYSITLITNVFLYFDINEQKNATGTFEKIDNLGS